MYFGHKHVETGENCSYEIATFLKYHMPLMTMGIVDREKNVIQKLHF